MKAESKFLQELEGKAQAQQKLMNTELIPAWAKGVGGWLAVNPWRVIVPIAIIGYVVCRMLYGVQFSELTLQIFGGFT